MITVTLAVVCYSTAASSYDSRVVLVRLGVAGDLAPPPSSDAPRLAPSAAAGGGAIAFELVVQWEDDEEVTHLHAETNAEIQEAYHLNPLLQEGASVEVDKSGVAAAAARHFEARFPRDVYVARRVVARWRAFVAERKGVLLLRLPEELPDLLFVPPLLDLVERHPDLLFVPPPPRPGRTAPRPLCGGGAAAAGPHRSHHARAGGAAVAGGGAGLGATAHAQGGDGAAPSQGVLHVCRAAGLGQGERLPMGGVDPELVDQPLCSRRLGRTPGGATVGVAARLSVG